MPPRKRAQQDVTRWWWAAPRRVVNVRWELLPHVDRLALGSAVAGVLLEQKNEGRDVVVRDGMPVPGWVSATHSRDGKSYPCQRQTAGATPAWIWWGDEKRPPAVK